MKIYVTVHDGMVEVYSQTELEVVIIDVDDQSDEDPFWICEKPSNNPSGLIKDVTALATQVDPPELVTDLLAEQGIVITSNSNSSIPSLIEEVYAIGDLENKVSELSPQSDVSILVSHLHEIHDLMRQIEDKYNPENVTTYPFYIQLQKLAKKVVSLSSGK